VIAPASVLLLVAIALPAILTTLWLLPPLRRTADRLTPAAALPALAAALWPDPATLALPAIFTGLTYAVDAVGRVFLLLTALLWTAAAVYARSYIRRAAGRPVFFGFFLLTMCGNIGVTVAADALSFYLHFALLTFAAYALIVHERTAEAARAGRVYMVMAIAAEAVLLAALMLLADGTDSLSLATLAESYAHMPRSALVAALFAAGFAVKAGLAPLHLWLPLAHPVAPTPASALLSGALIKAGLLGWLRFLPIGYVDMPGLGATFLVLGLAGTLLAVAVGVTQSAPKIVLAYSSVSQMGFMAIGVGAALMVSAASAGAVLATTTYALHHGFAKAALFLAVGLVTARAARPLRDWPFLLATLPALALAGAPLTSGAVAKRALTTGAAALPEPWPAAIDILLTIAALATTLLMARFLAVLRTTTQPPDSRAALYAPWLAIVALSTVGALWLPLAQRPIGGLDLPGPFDGVAKSFWPVALGALLAFGVWRYRARLVYLQRARVPAGDLVILLERLCEHRPAWRRPRPTALGRTLRRARGTSAGFVGRLAAREVGLASGPTLGVLILLIAVLIAAAMFV
jgi:hydrogenase-4 component B